MPEYVIVKLSRPIEPIAGTVLHELRLREPRGADLRGLPDVIDDRMGWALVLAGKIVQAPPGTIDALPASDAMSVAARVYDFFVPTIPAPSSAGISNAPAGPAIGATSSG